VTLLYFQKSRPGVAVSGEDSGNRTGEGFEMVGLSHGLAVGRLVVEAATRSGLLIANIWKLPAIHFGSALLIFFRHALEFVSLVDGFVASRARLKQMRASYTKSM
jgi:hypothetical protein